MKSGSVRDFDTSFQTKGSTGVKAGDAQRRGKRVDSAVHARRLDLLSLGAVA